MAYNSAFSSPYRQVPPLPENHHNLKILCLHESQCTEIQPTSVFIECCHPTTFTNPAVCAIQLGKQHHSHPFATKWASTHSRNLSQTCPHYQTEPSNCQLNLARGYITSRGPHIHGFLFLVLNTYSFINRMPPKLNVKMVGILPTSLPIVCEG